MKLAEIPVRETYEFSYQGLSLDGFVVNVSGRIITRATSIVAGKPVNALAIESLNGSMHVNDGTETDVKVGKQLCNVSHSTDPMTGKNKYSVSLNDAGEEDENGELPVIPYLELVGILRGLRAEIKTTYNA